LAEAAEQVVNLDQVVLVVVEVLGLNQQLP
jgi:hypothetical protein